MADVLEGTKCCTKCGEIKPLDAFSKNARARDGRQPRCKCCLAEVNAKWYADNRERMARYRAENRERRVEYAAKYRERRVEYDAKWYAENRERVAELNAKWRAENPHKCAEYAARRRARKASAPYEPYSRSEIFARYGNTCAYCDAPAEHLDHVVPISRGGADAAHNLLPACAPCNLSKSAKSLAEWALSWAA